MNCESNVTSTADWVERSTGCNLSVEDFVEGSRRTATSDLILEKYAPRDGRLLYRFTMASARDVDAAVASAQAAFVDGRWSKVSAQRRKDVLYRLASLIDQHREELAMLECLDVGKPIRDALNCDVSLAAAAIRFIAEAADKGYGPVYGADASSLSYELRRPIGVVAGIVGWNFPLLLAAQKLGPALAAGNCMVLKPSELTSLSAQRLAELAMEAGLPEGVLNIVHGDGSVGRALALHKAVGLVSFTGSSHVGQQLLIASGESNMKRLILECGGKAPNIVFEDCPDLDAVAKSIVSSAFFNQGQVCVASSRLLVQDGIKEQLLRQVIERAAALIPGDPLRFETQFGALISHAHEMKVRNYIARGRREGAELVHQSGAKAPFAEGFYVPPAIFDKVEPNHAIAQDEIFGPVLCVLSFRDELQAVQLANSTPYGLSAKLWTQDLGRAHRVTQGISAGWIVVNGTGTPQGGVAEGVLSVGGHKRSGLGAEGGVAGLEAYCTKTAVQVFV